MKNFLLKSVLGAGLLAAQLAGYAADLDLYANPPPNPVTDRPNVLFVIDNTANWSQAFNNEIAAIKLSLQNLPEDKFNIGIMLATETGGSNSSISGGYVRAAIRPMTAANKAKYAAMVESFHVNTDKSSGGAAGLQMAEVYHYFAGLSAYSGRNKVKADYTGNTAGSPQTDAIHALPRNALSSFGAANYNSPVPEGSCAKNYIIYISNGPNQSNSSDNEKALEMLKAAAGGGIAGDRAAQQIPILSGSADSPMDEWTRFMRKSSLAITTFTIDVDRTTSGQGPGWTTLLKSAAGEGNYFEVASNDGGKAILEAVNEALSRVQSVNSVFAAVALPASANVQGAYLNQLYIGMFRPDEFSNPRWLGNLKQYKIGANYNLVDADEKSAISAQTGFINECARSFWTPPFPAATPDLYWSADPKSTCIPPGTNPNLYANADSPDGDIVEKGAASYLLRKMPLSGTDKRTVYSCSPVWATCNSMVPFNSTVATMTALGAATATEQDTLIRFARGENMTGELGKPVDVMRPSVHGDVIHSNPLALSYGSDVIVYYGSNDGMLHAINGNQTANYATTYKPGAELWSFMPPEYFPNIDRLYDNAIKVSVSPANNAARTGAPKPYGIDGPISAYRSGTSTNIYTTMRRGGRSVYAFNVTTPKTPVMLWRTGCAAAPATDCTPGAEGIGQTWSTARPTKARGHAGGVQPVLIMGGGYDDCEDPDVNTCNDTAITPNPKGRNILVLDAATGAVLKSLPTDRGVVGDIRVLPDAAGLARFGYAADLGGNIYRITIEGAAPSAWTITKIASLGCDTPQAACASNRKFMFAPSLIQELNGTVSLYLGSGDREKPLGPAFFPRTVEVANYFFKIIDKPTDDTWLTAEVANCGAAVMCMRTLESAGSTNGTCGAAEPLTGKGWKLGLRPREQVVTLAATRFGVTTFSTHMPDEPAPGVCTGKLGTVHVYNLEISTAAPTTGSTCSEVVKGGGLPPPPEKMDVCMDAACNVITSVCIGCSAIGPTEVKKNPPPASTLGSNAKRRVYWYIQK